MIRIVFQGDSITDGNRYKEIDQRWDKNHQIGHSYVFSIASYLGKKHPGKYEIINRGVSGNGVTQLLDRWQVDTLDEHPDILSILVGINEIKPDLSEGLDVHLRLFEANYRALLDSALAQNPNLKLIIMEPFMLPVGMVFNYCTGTLPPLDRRQEIIKKIAKDYNAIYIPLQQKINMLVEETADTLKAAGWEREPGEYWLWDGIHPTEQLHGYIAELWLEASAEILSQFV